MRNIAGDDRSRESRWSKHLAILGMSNANRLLDPAAIAETAWLRSKGRVKLTVPRSSENSDSFSINQHVRSQL